MTQEAIIIQPASQQAIATNALLIQCAIVVDSTNRQANVLATSVAFVAIPASETGHWQSYAFYFGVAGKTWWTATLFNVTSDFAFGVYATHSSYVARI